MSVAKQADPVDMSFEAALARLEEIVHKLETGAASLEDSITLYSEGVALKQQCEAKLKNAQVRIEKLQIGPDGKPSGSTPFGEA
jgi:exodeoxyribonuclease VII small subunit